MPRVDNEWGEWDSSQWEVPPRGTWFPGNLNTEHGFQYIPRETVAGVSPPLKTPPNFKEVPVKLPGVSLRDLRNWYVWARECGRNENYLNNICDLALKFKHQMPEAETAEDFSNSNFLLSSTTCRNMQEDKKNYHKLLEQFIENTKTILLGNKDIKIFISGEGYRCSSEDNQYSLIYSPSYLLIYFSALGCVEVYKKGYLIAYQRWKTSGEQNTCSQIDKGSKFVRKEDFLLFQQVASQIIQSPN